MLHDLYSNHANLYAAIANDRDFTEELNRIKAFDIPSNGLFVELFAGPAYHCIGLLNGGWSGKAVAIDNSSSMENISSDLGFTGNYLCTDAILGLDKIANANIIFIPRYSIVLVDREYVSKLFHAIASSLDIEGMFFLEIHTDSNIKNQLYIGGNWNELGIHKRVVKTHLGTIECIWPYTTKVVNADDKIVDMSVQITIKNNNNIDEHVFISREHLHTKSDILEFADSAGLIEVTDKSCELGDSYLLAFELKKKPKVYPSKNINSLAFNRIFDISSKDACFNQLSKSGLDTVAHDSPLSLHVYNLL
ncbi:MAG: hypothetical protein QM487_10865 [Candidatus Marithrix sp.]